MQFSLIYCPIKYIFKKHLLLVTKEQREEGGRSYKNNIQGVQILSMKIYESIKKRKIIKHVAIKFTSFTSSFLRYKVLKYSKQEVGKVIKQKNERVSKNDDNVILN